tara:strand:- start:8101 stop:8739 length:639 start_codon:yes stop_codon:yes gene_type:complete
VKDSKIIKLWLVKNNNPLKPITNEELLIASELTKRKAYQYKYSRGYVREILSNLFNISPLEIKLNAKPGKAPVLPKKFGHISFSHCNDALLIGWSRYFIGVDIERKDRIFSAKNLMDNFYCEPEKNYIKSLNTKKQKKNILKLWNLKEAAIKLQRGSIMKDLKFWQINSNLEEAFHNENKKKIKILHLYYEYWSLGIASEKEIIKPLICLYK